MEQWTEVLDVLQKTASTHVMETWMRPLRCEGFLAGNSKKSGIVLLRARDEFFQRWVEDHYQKDVEVAAATVAKTQMEVAWLPVDPMIGEKDEKALVTMGEFKNLENRVTYIENYITSIKNGMKALREEQEKQEAKGK